MSLLYDRRLVLQAGRPGETGLAWEGLNVSFEVTKTNKRGANKAVIKVANLSAAAIGFLREPDTAVQLIAGYRESQGLIFAGDIIKVSGPEREGSDRTTTIEAGEAEFAIREAPGDASLAPGATYLDALGAVARNMGLGLANALAYPEALRMFSTGWAFFGLAAQALDELCFDLDLTWSVQLGSILLSREGDAAAGESGVLLTHETGLTSPVRRIDRSSKKRGRKQRPAKGVIEFECLLQADIQVGRALVVQADEEDGVFVPERVVYEGEFLGPRWHNKVTAKERT